MSVWPCALAAARSWWCCGGVGGRLMTSKGDEAVDPGDTEERPRRFLLAWPLWARSTRRISQWSVIVRAIHGHNNGVPFYAPAPASANGVGRQERKSSCGWSIFCALYLVFFFLVPDSQASKPVAIFVGAICGCYGLWAARGGDGLSYRAVVSSRCPFFLFFF